MSAAVMAERLAAGLCPGDCGRKIPTGRLACPYHWSLLPIALRSRINAAWAARNSGCSTDSARAEHERWKGEAFHIWETGPMGPDMSGADLIAAERQRQIDTLRYDTEHDLVYLPGTLVEAARSYALYAWWQLQGDLCGWTKAMVDEIVLDDETGGGGTWPWDESYWDPSDDPVRNLVKAGALIAAEIDRQAAQA